MLDVRILLAQGNVGQFSLVRAGRCCAACQGHATRRGEGGPRAIAWTHADRVNTARLDFLGQGGHDQ